LPLLVGPNPRSTPGRRTAVRSPLASRKLTGAVQHLDA